MSASNFYALATEAVKKRLHPTSIGLLIAQAAIANSMTHERIFDQGDMVDFRNKERNRVFHTLEALLQKEGNDVRGIITQVIMDLLESSAREILDAHREIYTIHSVYDTTTYFWQHERTSEPRETLGATASLLGNVFVQVFSTRKGRPKIRPYALASRTPREEYLEYLAILTDKLNKRYSMQLYCNE